MLQEETCRFASVESFVPKRTALGRFGNVYTVFVHIHTAAVEHARRPHGNSHQLDRLCFHLRAEKENNNDGKTDSIEWHTVHIGKSFAIRTNIHLKCKSNGGHTAVWRSCSSNCSYTLIGMTVFPSLSSDNIFIPLLVVLSQFFYFLLFPFSLEISYHSMNVRKVFLLFENK